MKPADIAALTTISDPQLSPNGHHIAYVVTRIDRKANAYRSQIWVVPTDAESAPRALTAGEHSDNTPRWSPDGSQLAYTSHRAKDGDRKARSSVHLLPFAGPGETVQLAHAEEAFGDLAFSPDGKWLALTHRTRGAHYDADDVASRPARKIDHLRFSLDGAGFTIDRPQHVYVLATDGSGELRNLTPGPDECQRPAWFPDSSRVAFEMNRHRVDFATDIAMTDLASTGTDTAIELLTDGSGTYARPTVAADGTTVIVGGYDDAATYPQNAHVGALAVGQTAAPQWMTAAIDRTWLPFMADRGPQWAADNSLIAGIEDRGSIHLYRVARDGSDPLPVITGDLSITGWSAGELHGSNVIAYVATKRDQLTELYVYVDGVTTKLTAANERFAAAVGTPRPGEHFLAPSAGHDVDAWIYRPHDFDPTKKYPALLNIHGGPFTQYGNYFFDEFQIQANAGYVVLCSNPRGGSGRDTDWAHAILGPKHKHPGTGWGGADYDDCIAVVDAALDQYDFIDADRVGVLGGSYGGYMTSWIVTHTDRFAAGCSERAVNNMVSLEYSSDIAGMFSSEVGVRFVDDPDEFARMSPITYVKDLNTPLLIVHSEDDLRCPADQATQLFVACQLLEKPDVDYWLFPGEGHELSRSGSPAHRTQRAEIIVQFFDRHLATP